MSAFRVDYFRLCLLVYIQYSVWTKDERSSTLVRFFLYSVLSWFQLQVGAVKTLRLKEGFFCKYRFSKKFFRYYYDCGHNLWGIEGTFFIYTSKSSSFIYISKIACANFWWLKQKIHCFILCGFITYLFRFINMFHRLIIYFYRTLLMQILVVSISYSRVPALFFISSKFWKSRTMKILDLSEFAFF